jgi:APA family basic amino acid/polyamine antiporter
VYLREAYGPRVAFLYGWKCLLVMDPGITAALAAGLASYVGYLVPLFLVLTAALLILLAAHGPLQAALGVAIVGLEPRCIR